MSMSSMRTVLLAAVIAGLAGCAGANRPLPEVDWASYRADPKAYAGQRTLIRVDLATIAADPKAFSDKELIVRGKVTKLAWGPGGSSSFNDYYRWYLLLEDATGAPLRCYEETYRTEAWDHVLYLTHRAREEGGELTAVGRYRPGYGLELDWITYGDTTLDTDRLEPPARFVLP